MRGATREECFRVAVKGDTLHVVCSTVQTQYSGNTEVIYALGKLDTSARVLVFATPGTRLRITNVSRAIWPKQVKVIFGGQAVGTELMAWNYPGYRGDQFIGDPPVLCLCFLRSDPWTVVQLSDLGGVRVEIIANPSHSLALPTAEVKHQALAPVL